jgi:D-psicose/D-tagatose/L-ribulose 3-epimerase
VNHPAITGMYDTFHANIEEKSPVGCLADFGRHVGHVHISENDRGTPGKGHVDWPGVFRALKSSGYEGWLTIEAFGRALPDLAAATRVWRDFFPDPEEVYRFGFRTIKDGWANA